MSGHLLDQQPEERLFTQIKEAQDQIKELRTAQIQGLNMISGALNISRTADQTSSQTLAANSGGYSSFTAVRSPVAFPIIEETFYEDTNNDATKVIGTYLNNFKDHWEIDRWPNLALSTDSTLVYYYYVFNKDTVSHTIYGHWKARYIIGITSSVT